MSSFRNLKNSFKSWMNEEAPVSSVGHGGHVTLGVASPRLVRRSSLPRLVATDTCPASMEAFGFVSHISYVYAPWVRISTGPSFLAVCLRRLLAVFHTFSGLVVSEIYAEWRSVHIHCFSCQTYP